MERHGDTVWRVCLLSLRHEADAQDAFQDTFMRYALADATAFEGDEHRKAWLIRVATNACRDMLRRASRRTNVGLDEGLDQLVAASDPEEQPGSAVHEVIDAMRALDDPPRTPLYLALYEGYTAPEIAALVDAPVNTVYSWISRGRKQLKEVLA
ncbi:RNA polymerase sigma factor [Adlercreutzia sp. JBNU-10]|uniref:RNA polymerase sigma factor n=2 Tax=Adlercreutzia faecimuris TaxID=2897341 RepID=A0ABS9WJD8_9ACTN|nr:RNA polymerase sigma factor [Adlercreutzia sp. JBNU-10]